MGFSRQEYWSGLPLPSPKWELVKVIWGGTAQGVQSASAKVLRSKQSWCVWGGRWGWRGMRRQGWSQGRSERIRRGRASIGLAGHFRDVSFPSVKMSIGRGLHVSHRGNWGFAFYTDERSCRRRFPHQHQYRWDFHEVLPSLLFKFLKFYFWPYHTACGITTWAPYSRSLES